MDQAGGDWLTVSPLEGTGNGTLTISADKNNGPKRSATLTIAAKGAELRTITVIQDGYKGTIYNYGDFTGLQKTGLVAGINPITIVDNDECEDGKALRISVFSLKLSPHDTKEALHNTPIAKYKYLSFIMIVFIVSFSSSNSD